jgi:UDP-glucose 4-epimerase
LILELLRKQPKNLDRLVFASSAAVYGDEPTLPKHEESVIRPLTPYAVDKFASERMVLDYSKLYGLPTSSTRFFNVYGPNQNPSSPYSGFISILVDRVKNDKELTIFGDGEQSRDFTYVDDVVQALILVATSPRSIGEVYNVGVGGKTTLNDLVQLVNDYTGKKLSVIYDEPREGDIPNSTAGIDKLRKIGFNPKYNIVDGFSKYLSHEQI